ncbi:pyrimidine utilization protein D [Acinetobacter sp. ANC 4641]|uniref:pyrimidine utilization protein D n=1 Tax=Acinetobacter sp. ANC 4641 TaxID=2529847 RepID=UPI001039190B|nr:pyrimidine utilization protein D [Acinetobacter sp. ANC 4641]TCB12460.1 pyrimidine utilization protein D [Acinetobacter sp. ANC 4641]
MTVSFYRSVRSQAKTVVLSSGLGGHAQYWQAQITNLQQQFHVLTYDQAGVFPESEILPERYSVPMMANELQQILQAEQIRQCHFIGHALGGFIGLELARQAPQLVDKLVVVNAWDWLDVHTNRCFATRLTLLRQAGVAAYVQAQALFLYPPAWISQHNQQLYQQEQHAIAHFAPLENVEKRLAALRQYQPEQTAREVSHPVLVIANQDDFLVPWQRGLALSRLIPHADFELYPIGGHASSVTQPDWFNSCVLQYLCSE